MRTKLHSMVPYLFRSKYNDNFVYILHCSATVRCYVRRPLDYIPLSSRRERDDVSQHKACSGVAWQHRGPRSSLGGAHTLHCLTRDPLNASPNPRHSLSSGASEVLVLLGIKTRHKEILLLSISRIATQVPDFCEALSLIILRLVVKRE